MRTSQHPFDEYSKIGIPIFPISRIYIRKKKKRRKEKRNGFVPFPGRKIKSHNR